MPHVIDQAPTGRAKCRACGGRISAGEQRLGERLPNPYDEKGGEMTHWFHLACSAFMRPEVFLETIATTSETIDNRDVLEREAKLGTAHRRLPRVTTAARATTGRAACRSCHEPIEKGTWRISLVFHEEGGRFVASGFIHPRCAASYLETTDILPRVKHFSPELTEPELAEIEAELVVNP